MSAIRAQAKRKVRPLGGSARIFVRHSPDSGLVSGIFCLIEALQQRVVRLFAVVPLILVTGLHGPVAQAGVYTDDLSNCLVKSSNGADRLVLVQWIFSGLSLHPAVQPLVSITTEQRDAFNEKVAALLSRLLVNDCRKEAIDALKYEGSAALDASFQVLGQVASRDLMTEPHVAKGLLSGLPAYLANDLANTPRKPCWFWRR